MDAEPKKSKRGGARKNAGRKPKAIKEAVATKAAEIVAPEIPKRGRPVEYDAAVFFAICERIAEGEFLATICAEDEMPSTTTFRRWKNADEQLRLAYARAREDRADSWADDLVMIADDGSRDYKEVEQDGKTRLVVDHDHIARARLRVDARKWVMAKHAPAAYGDRVSLEHTGKDGGPIETQDMTDRELAKRAAFLLRRAEPRREGRAKESRH